MSGQLIIKNGAIVSGSIIADSITGSFSGSFTGTISNATSASFADSASFASSALTASFATSASFATTSLTASFVNPLTQSVSIRGTGTTSATTTFRVENSSGTARLTVLDDGTSAFNTSHLYISSSGNVGVGTSTPANKFTVIESISGGGNAPPGVYISLSRPSSGGSPLATYFTDERYTLSGTDSFGNSLGKQLFATIVSTGTNTIFRNVMSRVHTVSAGRANSIAHYATHAELTGTGTVSSWVGMILGGTVTGFPSLSAFQGTSTITNTYGLLLGNFTAGTQSNAPYAIYQAGTEKIYLQGNIGIGTTTPSFRLDVSGSGRFTNGLTVTGSLISPSITGSLFGTASFANTASFAISSSQSVSSSFSVSASQAVSASYAPSTPAFPYTGSAEISGSLVLSGSAIIMGGAINSTSTGTTSGTDALIIRNSNQDTLLNIKDDGDISINTTKYSSNGVLTNNAGSITEVVGFNGIVSFPTNPPGQQNLQFTNGILVNVF